MDKDIFTLFARYNQGVNEKMDALIQTLSGEEWNHEFGGYFKSVRSLCSHLYIADFTWLKRFGALREFQILKSEFFSPALSFKETLFPEKHEYLAKRPELDKKIAEFIGEITGEDLKKTLKYTNSEGKAFEKNCGNAVFQFFNHGSHHRGMISLYLELLGRENDFSSVLAVLE
jgi:uncharacterized damage-inducible protein DinB